ncbi:MAG: hypothetical protein FJ303_15115 [Planctomycetes bacterium]|nr:hypothetical protein [Planctomycetota bacterium]
MKRSTSGFFIVLAVFNLVTAIIPPVVAVFGVITMMSDSNIVINGRQVGPEFDKLVQQEAPMAKVEAFAALSGNAFCCLLILAGSVGLFMSQSWGRWPCVAGGLFMILFLLVHFVYQVFIYRAAQMTVVDRVVAPIEAVVLDPAGRNALTVVVGTIKTGMTVYTLGWSSTSSLFMLYFFVISLCMAFMDGFYEEPEGGAASRDADDERDRKKKPKKYDDDDDDRPPPKKRPRR